MNVDVAYRAASEAAGELRALSLGHRRTTTRQVNAVRRKLSAALSALKAERGRAEGAGMKLTGAMKFALVQVSRHGTAHSKASLMALWRRALVAPNLGQYRLTWKGKEALSAIEADCGLLCATCGKDGARCACGIEAGSVPE